MMDDKIGCSHLLFFSKYFFIAETNRQTMIILFNITVKNQIGSKLVTFLLTLRENFIIILPRWLAP